MRILEYAAAIALVIAPEKAARYLNDLGVNIQVNDTTPELDPNVELEGSTNINAFKRDLGL